jgi:hypothetical protein
LNLPSVVLQRRSLSLCVRKAKSRIIYVDVQRITMDDPIYQ